MTVSTTVSIPQIIGTVILSIVVLIMATAFAYRIIADLRNRRGNDEESLSQRSDLYSPRWSIITALAGRSNSNRVMAQTPSSMPTNPTNGLPSQQPPMSENGRRDIPAALRPAAGPPPTQSPYRREDRSQASSRTERGLHGTRPDSPRPPQVWADIPLEPRLSIPRV